MRKISLILLIVIMLYGCVGKDLPMKENEYTDVKITGIDIETLNDEEKDLLNTQARYCQAMCDADLNVMRQIVSEDMMFVHMSGMKQSREEYFADIADGRLNYYTIGIADPKIIIDGDRGSIEYTSILNANAYGARGTYRIKGTHHYEKRNGSWIMVNG